VDNCDAQAQDTFLQLPKKLPNSDDKTQQKCIGFLFLSDRDIVILDSTMSPIILWIVFVQELYHSLGHLIVLTGYRLLPRKNLVAIRYYFLFDAAGAAIAYYVHQVQWLYPLLILQQWQHVFYFSTWDKSAAAKRVISWSSLDWERGRWNQIDLVLGTTFDMGVHLANTYFIGDMLIHSSILPVIIATIILYRRVILGSKFAWASKSSMPEWVAKRIKPLTSEQRQEVQWMDQMIMKN